MSCIFTSAEAKAELLLIVADMKLYRGTANDEEVDYNGTKYIAGDLMGELRKDYAFWNDIYNDCLIEEGISTDIDYKLIKGYDE